MPKQKPSGHWNNDANVAREARKFKTRSEWARGSSGSYSAAQIRGVIDQFAGHMTDRYWNHELVAREARKFKTRSEWQKRGPTSYAWAYRLGLLAKFTAHMDSLTYKRWDEQALAIRARRYDSVGEWQSQDYASLSAARRRGLIAKLSRHMKKSRPSGPGGSKRKWTNTQILRTARRYRNNTSWWRNSTGTYCAAQRRGLLKKAAATRR